jgi:hypothetical protein
MVDCQWGPGKVGKACNSQCPTNYLTVTKNSHISGQKSGCKSGRYAPLCCASVYTNNQECYATFTDHVLSGSLTARVSTDGSTDYTYSTEEDDVEDEDDDVNDSISKRVVKRRMRNIALKAKAARSHFAKRDTLRVAAVILLELATFLSTSLRSL